MLLTVPGINGVTLFVFNAFLTNSDLIASNDSLVVYIGLKSTWKTIVAYSSICLERGSKTRKPQSGWSMYEPKLELATLPLETIC
jgi:hypothetical protein